MIDFVFVTGNQHKADYLQQWLDMDHPVEHQKVSVDELQSLDPMEIVAHKARMAYQQIGRPVLVEDVSLTFKAWNGLPGPLIKFFLEGMGTNGMAQALSAFENRQATASLIYGLYNGTDLKTFTGSVDGRVADAPRGEGWTGALSWNSIFVPDGSDKTYAEMTDEELRPFSHRAQAIDKLRAYLQRAA